MAAILFLYKEVLKTTLDWLDNIQRAKKSERLPPVFYQRSSSLHSASFTKEPGTFHRRLAAEKTKLLDRMFLNVFHRFLH